MPLKARRGLAPKLIFLLPYRNGPIAYGGNVFEKQNVLTQPFCYVSCLSNNLWGRIEMCDRPGLRGGVGAMVING